MTEPKKQDGTIELDVAQIDLLDLPLPPSSKRALDDDDAGARGSKGPPPLPPLPPGPAESAFESEAPTAELDPAAVAAAAPTQKVPVPSLPPPPAPAVAPATVSARKLVDGPTSGGNPLVRFFFGAGAAAIVCVAAFFAIRSMHKTTAAPAPSASPSAAPTHAFTMAPIEFTETPGASASATPSAAPEPSAKPAPSAATTTTAAPHATAHASHAPSAKPAPRPDDLIKVEN